MKNNSFSVRSMLSALFAFVLLAVVFDACKKEDTPAVVVDKTKLKARLDSANTIYTAAVEGAQVGQYEKDSKAAFKTSIDAATTLNNNANATQADVNNGYVNLGQAMNTFASKKVQEIAPQNLVLYLKMDGNANDASGKGLNGTLKAGSTGVGSFTGWGGGTPTPSADRYGTAGKAYFFDKGANIEVPYNTVLNPSKEISISLWARPTVIRPSNYLVSLNRWNGYKLQLQEANKAFMTVKTAAGKYNDKDNESPTLDVNKWYHITVTYKSGGMTFYLNGSPVKAYTDVTGDPYAVKSNINLTIGQDLPTSLYTADDKDNADGNNFYGPWGGYFTGDIDEVRIYNVVLSDTQVKSIYNAEKAP
ncbi:LamG-like jellyroll fold domain-containing protein [Spirosoma sp.]|uniref:LamG-like jellyroll fold domain-containing protein n=1 Tax=Spirosoma sp. TaxID=1899569 RepID=UPI003B3A56DA